ncbi:YbjQ family protein [Haladaptatus sp. NG-WS-4]
MTAFTYNHDDVLVTTSHTIAGREITEHLGIVIADVTPGRHIGKDIVGGLRDIVGGRSESWEKTLQENQEAAFDELVAEAKSLGADAVVAVDLADEALGAQGGMINVKMSGTAVSLD